MLKTSIACWMLHNTQCAMSYELGGQYWDVRTERIWMFGVLEWYTLIQPSVNILLKLFNSLHSLLVCVTFYDWYSYSFHVNIWLVLNQEESSTVIDRLTLWIQVVDSALTVKDFLLTFMLCSPGSVTWSVMRRRENCWERIVCTF